MQVVLQEFGRRPGPEGQGIGQSVRGGQRMRVGGKDQGSTVVFEPRSGDPKGMGGRDRGCPFGESDGSTPPKEISRPTIEEANPGSTGASNATRTSSGPDGQAVTIRGPGPSARTTAGLASPVRIRVKTMPRAIGRRFCMGP